MHSDNDIPRMTISVALSAKARLHFFPRKKDDAKFSLRQLTFGTNTAKIICLFFNGNATSRISIRRCSKSENIRTNQNWINQTKA